MILSAKNARRPWTGEEDRQLRSKDLSSQTNLAVWSAASPAFHVRASFCPIQNASGHRIETHNSNPPTTWSWLYVVKESIDPGNDQVGRWTCGGRQARSWSR